jgi:hypothetical protein
MSGCLPPTPFGAGDRVVPRWDMVVPFSSRSKVSFDLVIWACWAKRTVSVTLRLFNE